jgi:uncharacterized membrane protein YqgA involved in biofilm formation
MKYEKTFWEIIIRNKKTRIVIGEFIRGVFYGGLSVLLLIGISMPEIFKTSDDIKELLLLSVLYGSVTGMLLAIDKRYRENKRHL